MKPTRSFPAYRRAYARCCQIQHKTYGTSSLIALSYEAVALYLLCVDADVVAPLDDSEPKCCRLRVRTETIQEDALRLGKHCASAGVLLLETKIRDDIRDTRSIVPRALHFWFRRKFQKSRGILHSTDAGLLSTIDDQIESHLQLERSRDSGLQNYTVPTGFAFANLFASVTELFPDEKKQFRTKFYEVGKAIGQALIAYDCAADWWQDARRGQFNPVKDFASADRVLVFAADQLANSAALCRSSFGNQSLMSQLLVTRAESLLGRLSTPSTCRAKLEKAGFTREPGYTYAYCDGCDCDCGGCDGCEICDAECGSGCDSPEVDTGVDSCLMPVDCCCFCYEPACCSTSDKQKSSTTESPLSEANDSIAADIVGQHGKALTPLSPSGLIIVNGERHTATASHGFIEVDEDVIVSNVAPFGLIVNKLATED